MKKQNIILFIAFVAFSSLIIFKNEKPTFYIIGDSTVKNNNRPQCGWGEMIGDFFDTAQIKINNQAVAGRSTRSYTREKKWDKVLSLLKAGDFVIMQFGHNDGSKPDTSKAGSRGALRGIGEEIVELNWGDTLKEIVHTYGWYLRKFVQETKAKGATPIICSMIPRNQWVNSIKGDTTSKKIVKRADNDFGKWAKEIAESEAIPFIDLNDITGDKYDEMGPDLVKAFFSGDHTHTNVDGAKFNATSVIEGIRTNEKLALNKYLINKK